MVGLEAAEQTAEAMVDAAGRLVDDGLDRSSSAALEARARLADASEAFAEAIRPRRRRAPVRALLVVGAAVTVGILLYRSPLGARLRQRLSPDIEPEPPESIVLPATPGTGSFSTAPAGDVAARPGRAAGDGVLVGARPEPGSPEPPSADADDSAAGTR